jgi:hypothetical protein
MKIERFIIQACCGRKSLIFKTDQPLSIDILNKFVELGFKEAKHFTKAGILWVDNINFIITGPIGSNKLQVKCKKKECDSDINDLETLLLSME